jgi:hypothetical protein
LILGFYLDDVDRNGIDNFCRLFGRYAIDRITYPHHDIFSRYDVLRPAHAAPLIDDSNRLRNPPPDQLGSLNPRHVAVGLSHGGTALELTEFDGNRPRALTRLLPLAELAALGPSVKCSRTGAVQVGLC